jgi:DNA topoisomerase VI subunit B
MTMDLKRQIFKTSRECEYFTEKELRAQIGYDSYYWPLAVLRELIDNALDACEMAGVSPRVDIEVEDDRITVSDNGPGISPEVIQKSLDYLIRVSDKGLYVDPESPDAFPS